MNVLPRMLMVFEPWIPSTYCMNNDYPTQAPRGRKRPSGSPPMLGRPPSFSAETLGLPKTSHFRQKSANHRRVLVMVIHIGIHLNYKSLEAL